MMGRHLVGNLHVCEATTCGLILGPHEQIYEARRLYSPPHLQAHKLYLLFTTRSYPEGQAATLRLPPHSAALGPGLTADFP